MRRRWRGAAPHPPVGTFAGPSLGLRAFVIRNDSLDRFVGCADPSSPPPAGGEKGRVVAVPSHRVAHWCASLQSIDRIHLSAWPTNLTPQAAGQSHRKAWVGRWSPSPLWGGVGERSLLQNPSRLPATLPTRGRVENAAPPQVPHPIALPQVGRRNLLQRFVSLAPLAGVRRTGRDTRLDPGRVRVRGNCPDPAAKQEHQTSHRRLNIS